MPPQIADNEGWPFRMLGPVPYRPDSFEDWQGGILEGLISSADEQAGVRSPFHSPELPHD